jgi:hypothetical protein
MTTRNGTLRISVSRVLALAEMKALQELGQHWEYTVDPILGSAGKFSTPSSSHVNKIKYNAVDLYSAIAWFKHLLS